MSTHHTNSGTRIAVIGGGIAGLTAAYRLAQRGYDVVLWEQANYLGGQAAAFEVNGGYLEHFYHHLFMSDNSIVELIEELGIDDHLIWLDSKNDFYAEGKIFGLSSPLDLLRLPVIPFIDRIRVGLVTLYLQRTTKESGKWRKFEQITAWEWLRRKVGQRAFDRIFGAQLRAKFGRRAEEVAMVWFWNKIFLRTQSRQGLFGKEKLGYILGSFNVLIDRLADANHDLGVDIRVGIGPSAIDQDTPERGKFMITGSDGREDTVDRIVATVPSPVLLKLFPDIDEPYRSKLTAAVYQGAVCMLLEMDRNLSDTYWMNIVDTRLPFTGIIEHTNFIGPEHYNGSHYLYISKYVDWDHPYVSMNDEDLLQEYLPKLQMVNPAFDRSWITNMWVFRAPAAQPIIGLNYSNRIPEHRTPVPGLYLANTSQIYPEDRGTNYSVKLGDDIARIVDHDVHADPGSRQTS